ATSILNSGKTALGRAASNLMSGATTASAASSHQSASSSSGSANSVAASKQTPQDSIYNRQLKAANLVLGKPGLVLMVCQTSQGAMLVRGGVYTYYEVSGAPMRTEHLKRKLQFDLLRPPVWARTFDVVQEAAGKEPVFRKVQ
ncbi:MAG: hypothetical protein K2Y39_14220, partial [Candidatus Obscuribacterales bacterium]|nr:hypothetical protein [Candidatus Obscuribacterales bacterium]